MERLIGKALPTVLLSSFSTPHASILVTEGFSKQHHVSNRAHSSDPLF